MMQTRFEFVGGGPCDGEVWTTADPPAHVEVPVNNGGCTQYVSGSLPGASDKIFKHIYYLNTTRRKAASVQAYKYGGYIQ